MNPVLARARSFLTFPRVAIIVAPLLIVGTMLAQSRQTGTVVDEALRALNQGKYPDVERLLAAQTDARALALRWLSRASTRRQRSSSPGRQRRSRPAMRRSSSACFN
jgi:lambda repressor-like predicted transcriptional regulator